MHPRNVSWLPCNSACGFTKKSAKNVQVLHMLSFKWAGCLQIFHSDVSLQLLKELLFFFSQIRDSIHLENETPRWCLENNEKQGVVHETPIQYTKNINGKSIPMGRVSVSQCYSLYIRVAESGWKWKSHLVSYSDSF